MNTGMAGMHIGNANTQTRAKAIGPIGPRLNGKIAMHGGMAMTQMTRDEQQKHVEYVQQQKSRIDVLAATPPKPASTRPVSCSSPSPPRSPRSTQFLKSIAEFKPSGKFVLRI